MTIEVNVSTGTSVWLFRIVNCATSVLLGQAVNTESNTDRAIGDSLKLTKVPTIRGLSVTKAEQSQSAENDCTSPADTPTIAYASPEGGFGFGKQVRSVLAIKVLFPQTHLLALDATGVLNVKKLPVPSVKRRLAVGKLKGL